MVVLPSMTSVTRDIAREVTSPTTEIASLTTKDTETRSELLHGC